jgi:hypothetical protein
MRANMFDFQCGLFWVQTHVRDTERGCTIDLGLILDLEHLGEYHTNQLII